MGEGPEVSIKSHDEGGIEISGQEGAASNWQEREFAFLSSLLSSPLSLKKSSRTSGGGVPLKTTS